MSASGKLLVTGGAGRVSTLIRPHLREAGFTLRLLDRRAPTDPGQDETVLCDLSNEAGLRQAMSGCSAVLHLAGCATDAGWQEQVAGNVTGCIAVFEAARAAGVQRVIYASSNHVVGMYPRFRRLASDAVVRPDSRYGVTKAFGELVGSLFADKYDLRVLCIRIGSAEPAPVDRRRLSIWISPYDLAQLVVIGATHPELRFAVVYGVSDNARSFYDNVDAHRLGYRPRDRAEDHAAPILARDPCPSPGSEVDPGEFAQGGDFARGEFVGDPARLLER
jgi:uronate dehydrogenase